MSAPAPAAPDRRGIATWALVGATAVWGSTFVLAQGVVEHMPVLAFLTWRFALATAVLVVLRPRALAQLTPADRRHGVVLGLMLGGGYVLQTFGLLHTSATVSGFVTGMFVVFVPLIARVWLGEPLTGTIWLAVVLATAGLAALSLTGWAIGPGELLTLGCAAMFAGQIVGLAHWSSAERAYGLTVLQLGVVTLLCLVASPLDGGLVRPPSAAAWAAILFLAVVATAAAFLAQTWAQTHMSAPRAAIVLTLEPVFAGVFGVTLGGDQLSARIILGAALILAAMYVIELGPRLRGPAAR